MNEVLRQEKKFLINKIKMNKLSEQLSLVMFEDEHNHGIGYSIRSLYFDTIDDRDFEEKENGIEIRRKIRLRCYSPGDNFAKLEMKQKEGYKQKKRSLRLSREDAKELSTGNYSVLLRYTEPFASELFAYMNIYCYRPVSIVEYNRKAFIAKENNIRITFDHNIFATESSCDIFDENLVQYPVLDQSLAVMEVKYNGFLLSYIKDILRQCGEMELSVGKYSLSRKLSKRYVF